MAGVQRCPTVNCGRIFRLGESHALEGPLRARAPPGRPRHSRAGEEGSRETQGLQRADIPRRANAASIARSNSARGWAPRITVVLSSTKFGVELSPAARLR